MALHQRTAGTQEEKQQLQPLRAIPSQKRIQYRNLRLRFGGILFCLLFASLGLSTSPISTTYAAPALQGIATDLLITKYIDGTGNNKAIEIYNGTGSPKSLNQYQLEIYAEATGNAIAAQWATLDQITTGKTSINANEAIVIHFPAASAVTGYPWGGLVFDGGDAIILRELSSAQKRVIDSFGQTTNVPGGAWTGGGLTTQGSALKRKSTVCTGRMDSTAPFDPSVEWETIPGNPYEQLGSHQLTCAPPPPPPILNEFVFDHISAAAGNDREFIEVKVPTVPTGNVYSVLVVDGDRNANPGLIYYSAAINDIDIPGNGYWTRFEANRFLNGANTLLLVRNFTPPAGVPNPDIDQNDDGIIDLGAGGIPPYWTEVVDDVAVRLNQTDFVYAQKSGIVLYPYFDGVSTMPGGASRVPDAQRSGPFEGWKRNHYDGEGLGCSLCALGASPQEAVNTPGQANRLGTADSVSPTPTVSVTPPTATPTSTGLPSTPTPMPPDTPTTGPSPTPTHTATPLPGFTPPPPGCQDIIVNGSFEENHVGWKFGADPVPPRYTGDQRRFGARAVLLGNPPDVGSPNAISYSSVRQLVKIPAGASTAYITWSHLSLTQENPREPTGHTDRQDFIPLAPNQMPISIKYRALRNESNWRDEQRELTDLIGKNFYVYFNVFNDGNGLRTWMFLDNVQLIVCYPNGVAPAAMETPTPVTVTGATTVDEADPTFTPTVLGTVIGETATFTPTSTPVGESPLVEIEPLTFVTPSIDGPDTRRSCSLPACENGKLYCAAERCQNDCGFVCVPTDSWIGPQGPVTTLSARQSTPEARVAGTPVTAPTSTKKGPPGCIELIENGDFETIDAGWEIKSPDATSGYETEFGHSGSSQSMRVAAINVANEPSTDVVAQAVMLPEGAQTIRLELWYYPQQNSDDAGPGDLQYVDLYRYPSGQFEKRVLTEQRGDAEWLQLQSDLTEFAGQRIQLRLAVINDGVAGRSAMFVDDVSILACTDDGSIDGGGDKEDWTEIPSVKRPITDKGTVDSTPTEPDTNTGILGFAPNALGRLGTLAVLFGVLVVIGLLAWALLSWLSGFGWAAPIIVLIVGLVLLVWYLWQLSFASSTILLIVLLIVIVIVVVAVIRPYRRP